MIEQDGSIQRRILEVAIQDGFDKSSILDDGDYSYVRIGCSQCAAAVIQGRACHEQGCPNQGAKGGRDEDGD